jgi:hypothetical protein
MTQVKGPINCLFQATWFLPFTVHSLKHITQMLQRGLDAKYRLGDSVAAADVDHDDVLTYPATKAM